MRGFDEDEEKLREKSEKRDSKLSDDGGNRKEWRLKGAFTKDQPGPI